MTSTPGTDALAASAARSQRQQRGYVTSYGLGRTCLEPTCSTRLSRYNKSDLCWKHVDEQAARANRGRT